MCDGISHPEWRALLAAVRANPEDDLPRLVAADWLEEHGQPERAAWLRRQVLRPSFRWFPVGGPAEYALAAGVAVRLAGGVPGVELGASRGFVSHIRGPVVRLAEVLSAVAAEHPLVWADVTDRHPWRESPIGLYVWRRPSPAVPDRLPDHVFDMLNPDRGITRSYHQTKAEAVADLSDALIEWALGCSAGDAEVFDR